jgi:exonuclease SbcD
MRILHTSDWHVGKTLRGRSRADEHAAVLAEIAGIARAEAVDLVLVAGDLFDSAAPAPDAEQIVYRTLLDLADTGARVVVVAGNHDHPRRLDAVRPLLAAAGVTVAPALAAPDAGGVLDVEVARTGEHARVALLPFLSQRTIVRADDLLRLDADEHAGAYAGRLGQIVAALCAGMGASTVNLLVAHLMAVGGTLGGGERAAHTIFDYCVPATVLPASLHYAALGHLHRPQRLAGPCPTWYAGSPLQLDFGETADRKAVLLVDAAPGRPAAVREVALSAGRRLRTVRGTLAELRALAGTTGEDWLRVVIDEPPAPGLADAVREVFPHAVDVAVAARDVDPGRAAERPSRLGRSPTALFGEYLTARGVEDPRLPALFAELLDQASSSEAVGRGGDADAPDAA